MADAYKPVLGLDGPVYVGTSGTYVTANTGTRLEYISGPSLTLSYETEDLDMVATGMTKAYLNGKLDVGISFTMKNFQTESGAFPADISKIRAAFISGGALGVLAADSAIGNIAGDFIVTKMDETRENSKVISWTVEMKPTFSGLKLQITSLSNNPSCP
ncbi:MAG: hypothetical protein Q4D62_15970 [Planctomycetia bacterium]|nr:hypothetical protein [Planctomycetia bacterium]